MVSEILSYRSIKCLLTYNSLFLSVIEEIIIYVHKMPTIEVKKMSTIIQTFSLKCKRKNYHISKKDIY